MLGRPAEERGLQPDDRESLKFLGGRGMASGGHYRARGQGQGDELGNDSVSESESTLGSLEEHKCQAPQ